MTVGSPPAIEARSMEQFAPSLYPGLKTASGVRRLGGYGSGGFAGAARATLNRGSELGPLLAHTHTRNLSNERCSCEEG